MKTVDARMRIGIANIAFLTDLSIASGAALPFAAGFARRYGAQGVGVSSVVAERLHGSSVSDSAYRRRRPTSGASQSLLHTHKVRP